MLRAVLLSLALLIALPAATAASEPGVREKCVAMETELNAYRSPDVYRKWLLCDIAQERVKMWAAGWWGPKGDGHDIGYVTRRLGQLWGGCWRVVGEAIAYTTAKYGTATGYAQRFVTLWRNSATHWSMLSASRYDRVGAAWVTTSSGRTYVVTIVLDEC